MIREFEQHGYHKSLNDDDLTSEMAKLHYENLAKDGVEAEAVENDA
ncbi:hypothetical protein SYK_31270 [Pseudodesulfovibrio nedwellii]|uniref:Uncharacterized protein n=1 Tax=Pseudodesulfovibrio nedwellii TaxID=2973072 RepID=A0ABM8B4K3_9BACT|nr:hypothetical protein [Pseudodesulfovibrio nedwellii]BDQ38767.1 hypothetical protein SYK_31270 [Pseudodesulfovibrio nedwellii]